MLRTAAVLVLAFLLVGPGVERACSQDPDLQFWETERDTVFVARLPPLVVVGNLLSSASAETEGASEGPSTAGSKASATQETIRNQRAAQRSEASSGRSTERAGGRSPMTATTSHSVAGQGVATGGLLVNETFTVVGAQFYRAFYDAWSVPEAASTYNFTIRVAEQPAPRLGTQLTVRLEGTTLFQSRLRPNTEGLKQRARRAAQRAALYLRKYYEPRTVY